MTKRTIGLAVLLACNVSCESEELTQLMVVVDTDFDVPEEIDEIVISVRTPQGEDIGAEGPILADDLPMRLALVHRGGPLGPMSVTAEGVGNREGGTRGPLIQRFASVSFVEGEVRVLRMDLLRKCRGVVCPADQTCSEGDCRPRQVDEDELGVWDGPERLDLGMPDMGPPADMGPDACVASEEVCNGLDDDCDGVVDNGIDTDTDVDNCGECGNVCDRDPVRGSSMCAAGECGLVCDPGFADCDDDASTGCEASLSSAGSCGTCEQSCTDATPICDIDNCVAECPEGSTLCTDSCADLDSSVANCGTCGNECPDATNASPLCTDGSCALRCDMGYFNCDGDSANGCETQLKDNANCGACGVTCGTVTGTTSCATGTCMLISCNPGLADCDMDVMSGCEANIATGPDTCGDCDTSCPVDPPNATSICEMGSCAIDCDMGYDDCNDDPSDGCETFLGDLTSCGACGIRCDGTTDKCSGSTSAGFECTGDCAAGEEICGDSCVDTSSDVRFCGDCITACPDPARASPTCTSGSCGFTCDTGFDDCDDDVSNGCETSLTSTTNCGTCGAVCDPVANGTVTCSSTGCEIATCSGSNRNCDGTYANGCESDITSDVDNCGGCGASCDPGMNVTSVGCADGGCFIETCATGFADCDGDFATGCEQRLGTRNNCSACGDRCTGGATNRCCDGVCGNC